MQGEPKWFNTRQDVENWRAVGGEAAYKATLQRFYDGRLGWVTTGELTENESGVEDATHRILTNMDMETQAILRTQQELQADPNAYIFSRLGYTDGEVRAVLEL